MEEHASAIYSENRYQLYDLDFVTFEEMKKVKRALKKIGFEEKSKYFAHPECPWFIEFVAPPVAIREEPIREFSEVKTALGTIKMLKPIDSVKDRLVSFYHRNDRQSLEQAVSVCKEMAPVDLNEIERWSKKEKKIEKYKEFLALLS